MARSPADARIVRAHEKSSRSRSAHDVA